MGRYPGMWEHVVGPTCLIPIAGRLAYRRRLRREVKKRLTLRNHMVTVIGNRMVTQRRRQHDAVFRAISDPTRRRILGILRGQRQTVGEIASHFRMSRPAISKHLRILHEAGLVDTRKQGTANLCSLDARPLHVVDDWLQDYEGFWRESVRSLKKYMEEKS